jgi:CO/xanthine dehydrogenase Mo-binding subunit
LCFEKVAAESDFNNKWHEPGTRTLPDGRMHGIGIAGHGDSHGGVFGASGASCKTGPDGTVQIMVGIARAACGQSQSARHTAAETLGMTYDNVMVGSFGDTAVTQDGGMQAGSTRTIGLNSAVYEAALDLRDQMWAVAAARMGVTAEELDAADNIIFEKANPDNSMSYAQLCGGHGFAVPSWGGRGYTQGAYFKAVPPWLAGKVNVGDSSQTSGQSAGVGEIAVDMETGEIEVLGFWNAVDTGQVLFHHGVMNQIQGGTELWFGEAFYYEQLYDMATGQTLNTNWVENKWPTTMDIPTDAVHPFAVESMDYAGPFGAHGIGEPTVSEYCTVALAFYNATGVWPTDGPLTPDRVLKVLGKA